VHTRALYEEACLLANHARYPWAVALAVLGAEELVKSVASTIAALNPHERVRLPQTLNVLHHHDSKHGSAATMEGMVIETREGVDAEASMTGVAGESGSDFRETFLSLARQGLQGLLPSQEDAKAHAQALHDIAPDSARSHIGNTATPGMASATSPGRIAQRHPRSPKRSSAVTRSTVHCTGGTNAVP
jgi:AbiV family abortive infection protein